MDFITLICFLTFDAKMHQGRVQALPPSSVLWSMAAAK